MEQDVLQIFQDTIRTGQLDELSSVNICALPEIGYECKLISLRLLYVQTLMLGNSLWIHRHFPIVSSHVHSGSSLLTYVMCRSEELP